MSLWNWWKERMPARQRRSWSIRRMQIRNLRSAPCVLALVSASFYPSSKATMDDALARTATVLREKPLPAEKTLGRLIVKPERWKIADEKDATRMQWYGDTGLADTSSSGMGQEKANAATGRSAPQEKKRDFDLRTPGRSIAHTDSGNGEPQSAVIPASAGVRATPTITWPAPDPITYGDKLTAAQRDATASVPGTFVYTPGPGHVLPVGTHTLWVTFTPTDSDRRWSSAGLNFNRCCQGNTGSLLAYTCRDSLRHRIGQCSTQCFGVDTRKIRILSCAG